MNFRALSEYLDPPTIAFLTLGGLALAGMPYPFLGSFEVGVAGAIVSLALLLIRLRGENGWLIQQFAESGKDEAPPSLPVRIWRKVKLAGVMLLMAGLLGCFASMACALPVVWWAAVPFKQEVMFDYGRAARGRYLFDAYNLHFKTDGAKRVTLTWPAAIESQVGAGKPLAPGAPVTLEGRTSWAGTVIDRISVSANPASPLSPRLTFTSESP